MKNKTRESIILQVGWIKVSDQTILALHKKVITHNSRVRVTHDGQNKWNLILKQVGVLQSQTTQQEVTYLIVDPDLLVL